MKSLGNIVKLESNTYMRYCLTKMRDKNSDIMIYRQASDNAAKCMLQFISEQLIFYKKAVITPTNTKYIGIDIDISAICGVSIMRAGEAMEDALKETFPGISIGKILVQRNEDTLKPKLYYVKLPSDIQHKTVIVLEPMLATGNSAICVINELLNAGVHENKIIFANFISCKVGITKVLELYPNITIVTGEIDKKLNDVGYIEPGLGDAGDRYFGT